MAEDENKIEEQEISNKNSLDMTEHSGLKRRSSKMFNSLINVLIVSILIVATLLMRSKFVSNLGQKGYHCDDSSLAKPLLSSQTVSTKVLISASFIVSLALFCLVECSVLKMKKRPSLTSYSILKKSFIQLPSWLLPSTQLMGLLLIGSMANSILTDIGKAVIGWPRPYFLAACQPNVTSQACSSSKMFITDFSCTTNITQEELEDSFMSFPSAHASFAAYVAFFLVLYLQARLANFEQTKLLRPFLQLLLISVYWWSALTRVSDFVHHPADVLAGLILGTLVALWTCSYLSDLIRDFDLSSLDPHTSKKSSKFSIT